MTNVEDNIHINVDEETSQTDSQYEPEFDQFKSKSTSVPLAQSNTGMASSANLETNDINTDINNEDKEEKDKQDMNKPLISLPINLSDIIMSLDFTNNYQDLPTHTKVHNNIIGIHPEIRISHLFSISYKDLVNLNNDASKTNITFNKTWNLSNLTNTFTTNQLDEIKTLKVKVQLQIDGLFSKFSISFSKLQKLYKNINLNKNPLATILRKFIKQHDKFLDTDSQTEFNNLCENIIYQYEKCYIKNIKNKRENKLTNWYIKSADFIKMDINCLFDSIIGSSLFTNAEAVKIMIIWLDGEVNKYFTNRFIKIQNDIFYKNQKLQQDIFKEKERNALLEDVSRAINQDEKVTIGNLRKLIYSIVDDTNNRNLRQRSRSTSSRKSSKPSLLFNKNNNKNNKRNKNRFKNKNTNNNKNQQKRKRTSTQTLPQRTNSLSYNPRSVTFSG